MQMLMPLLCLISPLAAAGGTSAPAPVPVVYCTDLFHPHDDPDDHFDLVTVLALPELDVRAILLDQGDRQREKPGRLPLEQMFRLTGRAVPFAAGLSRPLRHPQDTGADQPARDQGAVTLLLDTLRESREPVTLIATGSVRDLCAAFNREPRLFRDKLRRACLNMGNAHDGREYNVDLDVHAYVGLMRSGLPIDWCPCRPFNDPGATFWEFRQADVLAGAPPSLQNFFIYALQQVSPADLDPLAALAADLSPWRHLVFQMKRQMWSTASMLEVAGLKIYKVGSEYRPAHAPPPGARPADVFAFVPARVDIDETGQTRVSTADARPNMRAFRITEPDRYADAMRGTLRWLLAHFPLVPGCSTGPP